jgi:hypothetical protein
VKNGLKVTDINGAEGFVNRVWHFIQKQAKQ